MHEQSLIAFVVKTKRDRYREILSNPRLRRKFTSQLAHFKDFDLHFRLPIPSNKLFVDNIALELQKRHSPSMVFAISEDPSLDQKELPLLEALKETVGRGMGTVLSCGVCCCWESCICGYKQWRGTLPLRTRQAGRANKNRRSVIRVQRQLVFLVHVPRSGDPPRRGQQFSSGWVYLPDLVR
jgi:hypothetical protein